MVYLLPASVIGAAGAPLGTIVMNRHGPRVGVATGGALAVLGSFAMVAFPSSSAVLVAGLVLTTTAIYVCYGTLPLVVSAHVNRQDLGVVNAMSSLARWVGSAVVTALCSLLLTLGPDSAPLEQAQFRWTFLMGLVASVGVVIASAFVPGAAAVRPRPPTTGSEAPDAAVPG